MASTHDARGYLAWTFFGYYFLSTLYESGLFQKKVQKVQFRFDHHVQSSVQLRGMGIRVKCAVYSLFATAFSPAATQHFTGLDCFG